MFFSAVTTRKITDAGGYQTMTIVWKNASLASGTTITSLLPAWRNALTALNPTGSTPGNWETLSEMSHDDGAATVSAASTACDAIVSISWSGQLVRTLTVKNTTQSKLSDDIAAAALTYFGITLPGAYQYITNITIKIKGA